MDQVWQSARLYWQISTLSGFVATCADDEERVRRARELSRQAFATAPEDLGTLEEIAQTLVGWADDLADHPYHPRMPRPYQADIQIRDYVKDILRDRASCEFFKWVLDTKFSAEIAFLYFRSEDPQLREDAYYAFGRASMALDLGHHEAAERELKRLKELGESAPGNSATETDA